MWTFLWGVQGSGRPGLALIVLSVVEQRLDGVRAVLAGAEVTEVAARIGVQRVTVHRWVARYLAGQIGGLADRSHRPASCPHQAAEVVGYGDVLYFVGVGGCCLRNSAMRVRVPGLRTSISTRTVPSRPMSRVVGKEGMW